MANFAFQAKLSDGLGDHFSDHQLEIIEAIAYGYSNKSIANEYNISVKAVEKTLTKLNKEFKSNGKLYSSRVRILCSMIADGLLDFESKEQLTTLNDLSDSLKQTLLLNALGISNHTMAELFKLTDKCIEQRLSQLFDFFGIDTKHHSVENPRVLLLVNALLRDNLKQEQLKKLFKETSGERLLRIIQDPEFFISNLNNKYKVIG